MASRVCYLLCNALYTSSTIALPSRQSAEAVLEAARLFGSTQQQCLQNELPFLQIPATLRGRLARSTSCTVECNVCITVMLLLAVASPASICPTSQHVGSIWNVGQCPIPAEGRVAAIGEQLPISFQNI